MSTLAELLVVEVEYINRATGVAAAAELRRLAQVEAEHAALLKAIMDAEPVAWIDIEGTSNIVSAPRLYSDGSSSEAPLYTLNGIKK